MDSNIEAIAELYGYKLVKKEDIKMIKVDNGRASYEGSRIELLSELTSIMNEFIRNGVASVDDLHHAVSLAALSDKELEDQALETLEKFIRDLRKANDRNV